MKTAKFRWITLIGLILTIVLTVAMGMRVKSQDVSYKEVEAKIVSAEKRRVKSTNQFEVVVEYNGKKYDLKNVRSEEFSRYQTYKGGYATVYFADDKMYSNITGIKTDGVAYYIYLGALFSTIALLVLHIVSVKNVVKEKEKTKDML